MSIPYSTLKSIVIAIVAAVILVAAGIYIGAFYVERDGIRNKLNDSMLQIALNPSLPP